MQNITNILFPVIAIAISLGIAYLAGRVLFDEAKDKSKRRITQVVVFFVCVAIGSILIVKSHAKIEENRIDAVLAELPFTKALKKSEPKLYQQYYNILQRGVEDGLTKTQMQKKAMALTENIMLKRIPTADDDAVIGFVEATMLSMDELRKQSGELCYRFLFPESEKQPLNASKYLSPEAQKKMQTAMGNIILQQQNVALPSDDLVQQHMSTIMMKLGKKYGTDTAMALGNPTSGDVSQTRICNISYDFYGTILEEERPIAATIMRSLTTDTSKQ